MAGGIPDIERITPFNTCFAGMTQRSCELLQQEMEDNLLRCPTEMACSLRCEAIATRPMDTSEYFAYLSAVARLTQAYEQTVATSAVRS